MTETAAVSAAPTGCDKQKMTHEQRKEAKRLYMKALYQNEEIAAAKRAAVLRRYHERVPNARYGIRGRRPKAEQGPPSPENGGCSATSVILAGAALGAAVAALL